MTDADNGTPVVAQATSETPAERRAAARAADMAATHNPAATQLAMAIAGLVGEGWVMCPSCRELTNGRFTIREDGSWWHFLNKEAHHHGDAVNILQLFGVPTGDAVNVLLGRPTREPIEIPADASALTAALIGVKTKIDIPVFNGVLTYGRKTGGVEAACEFYGTWHISPEAVIESGAVLIKNPDHFAKAILAKFGEERLLACGLFVRTARGELYSLISTKFPVVEPHRHPVTGDVLTMQFRSSHAQYRKYLAHKAGLRDYKGSEKFISIKGAPTTAQIGTGLPRIETLPAGTTVYIAEGFKDQLAARTMGQEAYGLPGAHGRPPAKICALLARHDVRTAFDGDEAGDKGTVKLSDYLAEHGVTSSPMVLPAGLDITDVLVGGFAYGSRNHGSPCACTTCATFRKQHPKG